MPRGNPATEADLKRGAAQLPALHQGAA
jgi:hypothetical protein